MPTGAKLAGAIIFFAIGYVGAMQAKLTFEEGTPATYFNITIAMIGLLQGWMVVGRRAGEGFVFAASNGLRAGAQIAFFGLVLFALRTMFLRSMDLRYSAPGEAATEAMELFLQYFLQSLTVEIWSVLLIGGIIGGLLTELAGRAWR
ncbi:TrgA family protein [Gymnodinialimonas sp.]